VQTLLDKGVITKEDAPAHCWRQILTQALGKPGSDLQVESSQLKLGDGDCLLLCTDGLTEMVPDAKIVAVLGRGRLPLMLVAPSSFSPWIAAGKITLL